MLNDDSIVFDNKLTNNRFFTGKLYKKIMPKQNPEEFEQILITKRDINKNYYN